MMSTTSNRNFFPKLTAGPILRHFTSLAPGSDLIEAMTGIGDATSIGEYIAHLRERGEFDRFAALAAQDLIDRRDDGALSAYVTDEQIDWLDSWNDFALSPAGADADPEVMYELCAPVLSRIEAQIYNLATRGKNMSGRIRDHHKDLVIEPKTIASRISSADSALIAALQAGDTTDLGYGALIGREKNGDARVLLRDGEPLIQVRRKNAKDTWHYLDLQELSAEEDCEMDYNM